MILRNLDKRFLNVMILKIIKMFGEGSSVIVSK